MYERCSLCGAERSRSDEADDGDPTSLRTQVQTLEQVLLGLHAGQIFEERIRISVSRMCALCSDVVRGSNGAGLDQPLEARIAFAIERLESQAGALEGTGPMTPERQKPRMRQSR